MDRPLYHLALVEEWEEAQRAGEYRRSTVDRSLEEEGFIHASFAEQVRATADAFYTGRPTVLLAIDPAQVPSEVKVESIADGRQFPHVYGPIPVAAVRSARPVPMGPDGVLDLDGLLPEGS